MSKVTPRSNFGSPDKVSKVTHRSNFDDNSIHVDNSASAGQVDDVSGITPISVSNNYPVVSDSESDHSSYEEQSLPSQEQPPPIAGNNMDEGNDSDDEPATTRRYSERLRSTWNLPPSMHQYYSSLPSTQFMGDMVLLLEDNDPLAIEVMQLKALQKSNGLKLLTLKYSHTLITVPGRSATYQLDAVQ